MGLNDPQERGASRLMDDQRGMHLMRFQRLIQIYRQQGLATFLRKAARRLLGPVRERLALWPYEWRPWKADGRPVFLLASHMGGGGTEKHVTELMQRLRQEGIRPLLLRPDRAGRLIWEERTAAERLGWCRRTRPTRASIDAMLALLAPRHVHIHHMMGHPDVLLECLEARGLSPDWTIHDYHGICPRVHLSGSDGSYCGEPDSTGCTRCLRTLGDYHGRPFQGEIGVWRSTFARRLRGARQVFVPSENVARRLERYLPGRRITVRPHFEELSQARELVCFRQPGDTVRVAVIGAIVQIKGSERLLACARHARENRLPLEFHIIGPTDRDREFRKQKNVRVTGPYREAEVFDHLGRARCHLAFLPSLWPETYMYTLSIAMAAGLYTVCYDIGAQADRLREWGHGRVLALSSSCEELNRAFLAAADRLAEDKTLPPERPLSVYPDLLADYYGFSLLDRAKFGLPPAERNRECAPHFSVRTNHAHLH